MSSILDIDLDYFKRIDTPTKKLSRLYTGCPISFVVENHHKVLRLWRDYYRKNHAGEPKYLLHVDEHHDMMDEKSKPNIANFVYHAMREWTEVRVHWLVDTPIVHQQCGSQIRLGSQYPGVLRWVQIARRIGPDLNWYPYAQVPNSLKQVFGKTF